MDHMNFLGDTLQLIAAEKAGIIKQNVPVVIGESSSETEDVFISVAADNNAPISFADKNRYVTEWHHENGYLLTSLVDKHNDVRINCKLDLPGYYQLKNLVTVAEVVCQLGMKGFELEPGKMINALQRVKKTYRAAWQMGNHSSTPFSDTGRCA